MLKGFPPVIRLFNSFFKIKTFNILNVVNKYVKLIFIFSKSWQPLFTLSYKTPGANGLCGELIQYTEQGREMIQYEVKFTDKNVICERTCEVQHYTRPEATLSPAEPRAH